MILGEGTDYAVLARNLVSRAYQMGHSAGIQDVYIISQDLLDIFS